MSDTESHSGGDQTTGAKTLKPVVTLVISLFIFGISAVLIAFIYSSEPKAQREAAVRETAMLVEVAPVTRGTYQPRISGLGTVVPAQDVMLSPRVPGRVTDIAGRFLPGGFADAGDTLLSLDPADYRNTVRLRESALRQAESALAQERGRGDVAERDFEVLGRGIEDSNPSLALREPQLAAALAEVAAAEVALEQARLDLARTEIKAPFDAHILTRDANVGSEVGPGDTLARLVGIDEYHIIVTVPLSSLKQLVFPSDGATGASVVVRDRAAWAEGQTRLGRVRGLIGAIDGQTRLARVLVSVADPLGRMGASGEPALIVGSIVQADIDGRALEGVVRLKRDHLRQDDTVWVMKDGVLDVRKVKLAFKDTRYAYVQDGLEEGDTVVTSSLATVANGLPLRVLQSDDTQQTES